MALDNRWNSGRSAQDQANQFLRTGSTQGIYNPQVVGAPRAGCGSSSDCASGWYCSGGYCVKKSATGTASGTPYDDAGGSSGGSGGGGSTCDGSELPAGDVGQSPVADGSGGDTGCGGGNLSPCAPGDGGGAGSNNGGLGGNSGGGGCGGGAMGGGGSMPTFGGAGDGGFGGDGAPGSCQNNSCGEDPGSEDPDNPGGGGGSFINPGPNGGAGGDCCGTRCCRFFASGVRGGLATQCFCGPCPPPQRCDKFCAAFSAANGRDAPGCPSSANCDECSECVEFRFWAFCEPKTQDAPCQCEGANNACADCEICSRDGICEPDCIDCQKQVTMEVSCEGGCTRRVDCYVSPCDGSSAQCELEKCQELACREPCPAGTCSPTTTESSQSCNPGVVPPACPAGQNRTGTIEIGRDTDYAYSCSICSATTENADCRCKQPCNCHADCGDCQKCGPNGCEADSQCPGGASAKTCPTPQQPNAPDTPLPDPE